MLIDYLKNVDHEECLVIYFKELSVPSANIECVIFVLFN